MVRSQAALPVEILLKDSIRVNTSSSVTFNIAAILVIEICL